MASWFNQERGIVTVCQAVVGDLGCDYDKIQPLQMEMEEAMDEEGLAAFCEVNIVKDFEEGVINITQANGYAGLQSNTIMFGWPDDADGMARLLRIFTTAAHLNISSILTKLDESPRIHTKEIIDIWWRGKQANGDLMLLLGHLLTLNPDWNRSRIRLRTIVEDDEAIYQQVREAMEELVAEVRIRADIEVIKSQPEREVLDQMEDLSRDANLVFLGMNLPGPGKNANYAVTLFDMGKRFRNVVFVRNSGKFAGSLI